MKALTYLSCPPLQRASLVMPRGSRERGCRLVVVVVLLLLTYEEVRRVM